MRTTIFAGGLAIGVLAIGLFAWDANATSCTLTSSGGTCSILDIGDSATVADGTQFFADPNPTTPSTGSGIFKPFLTTQTPSSGSGVETGFNSDATGPHDPADQTKPRGGPNVATRSVLFGDLATVNGSYVLSLDADQLGQAQALRNQINIDDLKIYIGPNLANITTLSGLTPAWTLDNGNGNVTIILQASICDTPGQCGSGHGDLDVFIPQDLLGIHDASDNFVLYTQFSRGNDGFEEWRFLAGAAPVPEPTSLLLLGSGLAGLGLWQWKRRKDVQV